MISIIIPVYNTEKYLEKCVRSVLAQKEVEKEIILVDDGSTDNSPALCDQLSNSHPELIKVIHQENGGVSAARNTGIQVASGEWVAFIDADDEIENDMFKTCEDAILRYPEADIVLTGYTTVDWNGRIGASHGPINTAVWKRGGYSELFDSVQQKLDDRGWLCYFVWNKLYKRDIIRDNDVRFRLDMKYGEDFLFNVSYYKYVNSILTVKGAYYHYWKHGQGTATAKFIGNVDLLNRRTLYYEANVQLFEELGLYDKHQKDIDQVEAQQIFANSKWIFMDSCQLSFEDKVKHCEMLVNEYKYGKLIEFYPTKEASCVQRIQVKLLIEKHFFEFVVLGELLERIQKAKNLVKRLLRK